MISWPDGRQINRSRKQRLNERRPLMMELYLFREVGGKAHEASRGLGTTDSGKVNERRDSTLETRGSPELEEGREDGGGRRNEGRKEAKGGEGRRDAKEAKGGVDGVSS